MGVDRKSIVSTGVQMRRYRWTVGAFSGSLRVWFRSRALAVGRTVGGCVSGVIAVQVRIKDLATNTVDNQEVSHCEDVYTQ